MKAKIKQAISFFFATIISTFIIIASVVQWVPSVSIKTSNEYAYTTQLMLFLQNSTHLQHYLQNQNEDIKNEAN